MAVSAASSPGLEQAVRQRSFLRDLRIGRIGSPAAFLTLPADCPASRGTEPERAVTDLALSAPRHGSTDPTGGPLRLPEGTALARVAILSSDFLAGSDIDL
ncbi:hypothetical protein QQY66_42965 [Streptomyces sp. DG2A-72]|uniref:hypothetical protein n=1 Tax=Streptomyces sp. DG2A-72 TaxID=3051386 RepID=UPI00265BB496|nr:hypothetical protein [Streptomyces sp. DG2A-72]MDO0938163.1 hypothetical protein [Streptomyces sp. DG2A-72]